MRTFFIWAGFHRLGRDDLIDHLIAKGILGNHFAGKSKTPGPRSVQ